MINPDNTCFFTGHRIIANSQVEYLENEIKTIAAYLIEQHNVTEFITGGALGFDTIAAYAILELKEIYPTIKLHLYLPCTDQTKKWRQTDINRWQDILERADSHKYIFNHTYMNGCMQLRNRAMVNDSKYCIAYCTRHNSGSYSTVTYARQKGHYISMIN